MALYNGFSLLNIIIVQMSISSFKSSKGFKPVHNSSMMHPKAHISDLKLSYPFIYSGLIYRIVPALA